MIPHAPRYAKRRFPLAMLLLLPLLLAGCRTASTAPATPPAPATVGAASLPQPTVDPHTGTRPENPAPIQPDEPHAVAAALQQADPYAHGGCYVTQDPYTLHVNAVRGVPLPISVPERDDIVIHEVKYSLGQLQALQDSLTPRMQELQIRILGVSPNTNTLTVGVETSTEALREAIQDLAPDQDMVCIEEGVGAINFL